MKSFTPNVLELNTKFQEDNYAHLNLYPRRISRRLYYF